MPGAHSGTVGLRDASERHRPAPRLEFAARHLCRITEVVALDARSDLYELPVEQTWHAHRPELVASATSQIVSVDVSTGERIEHTSGPGLKLSSQFVSATEIGYLAKGGPNQGLASTGDRAAVKGNMRSPVWSPGRQEGDLSEGRLCPRLAEHAAHSWDRSTEYRYTDVFFRSCRGTASWW